MNRPKRAGRQGVRHAITIEQRHALRKWWNNTPHGITNQKEAISWWLSQYGWELKSSTCSDILLAE